MYKIQYGFYAAGLGIPLLLVAAFVVRLTPLVNFMKRHTDRIEKLLGKNDRQEFSVLLTHNLLYAESYIKWGADLTLCGHVNGGMLRLPFVGGIYSPERTFFPDYDGGQYPFGKQNLVVSRGIGNGNFGFRFLNCPEIVTIELYK